jgi:hypothetical protein
MNGKKAKKIRKIVYGGQGKHPGPVEYHTKVGQLVADYYRKIYQDTKMVNR